MTKDLNKGDLVVRYILGRTTIFFVCVFSDIGTYRLNKIIDLAPPSNNVYFKNEFYKHYEWSEDLSCWVNFDV